MDVTREEILVLGLTAGVVGSLVGGLMLGVGLGLAVNGAHIGWLLVLPAGPGGGGVGFCAGGGVGCFCPGRGSGEKACTRPAPCGVYASSRPRRIRPRDSSVTTPCRVR